MGVAGRGLDLGVAQQLANHGQAFTDQETAAGEGVAKVTAESAYGIVRGRFGEEYVSARLRGFRSDQPSTSVMWAMIFAESMPPFGSSRVSTNIPFSPPPSSWGRMSCPRYHARFSSQRAL